MPEGGFLVKFDNKKTLRCYAIAFDYDKWQYTVNNAKPKLLLNVKKISIDIKSK